MARLKNTQPKTTMSSINKKELRKKRKKERKRRGK